MNMLKRMKAGATAERIRESKRKSKDEVHKLFNYATPAKRKKNCFPTTDVEKDDILQAGLGEKEIIFEDLNIDTPKFRNILCDKFPQLADAGGRISAVQMQAKL